jgi:hypothetical protein
MPNVAGLVDEGGVFVVSPRYGPVPSGRRMFEVSTAETIELARQEGLVPVVTLEHQDGFLGSRA